MVSCQLLAGRREPPRFRFSASVFSGCGRVNECKRDVSTAMHSSVDHQPLNFCSSPFIKALNAQCFDRASPSPANPHRNRVVIAEARAAYRLTLVTEQRNDKCQYRTPRPYIEPLPSYPILRVEVSPTREEERLWPHSPRKTAIKPAFLRGCARDSCSG